MAFNPFTFLRLAGLLPGLGGLAGTAIGAVASRVGGTVIASKLAITLLRTAGFILNRSPVTLGLPFPNTPAGRLLTGPPTFLNPIGFPGINSFLVGFAFEDREALADGWLSWFGDLILADVPLVDSSLEKAIDALARGDLVTFGGEAADSLSQDIGLSDLAAFFRGLQTVEADFQAVGLPTLSLAPWVFGGIIGAVVWLDEAFEAAGRFLGGVAEMEEGDPLPPIPDFGDLPLDPGLRRGLPTTEEAVRRVGKAFARFRRRIPDLARIIDLLRKTRR